MCWPANSVLAWAEYVCTYLGHQVGERWHSSLCRLTWFVLHPSSLRRNISAKGKSSLAATIEQKNNKQLWGGVYQQHPWSWKWTFMGSRVPHCRQKDQVMREGITLPVSESLWKCCPSKPLLGFPALCYVENKGKLVKLKTHNDFAEVALSEGRDCRCNMHPSSAPSERW